MNYQPLWLSLKLASITTLLLLIIGLPLAWWLAQKKSFMRNTLESVLILPMILPPTVLGFYLLLAFAPGYWLGQAWQHLTGQQLAFSFSGLVLGSMVYSLPFMLQPLLVAFRAIGREPLELAATLGASPWQSFIDIVLPLSRQGLLSACTLCFAHTLGEFGVVLMIGGNIPGQTKVLSIAIYDHVEQLQYQQANHLALLLIGLCLIILIMSNKFFARSNLDH